MGKSKSGGTRALLRGRVGADVYSIGKDGKGKRQQVVRSLAEQVSNPQTIAQMRGRMIMSTVMQAVSALRPIIDHSFDGIAKGQPSISEFIRRNYALIKADVAAHPASDQQFDLVAYQQKGVQGGAYIISVGSVSLPSGMSVTDNGLVITLPADATTAGAIRSAIGVAVGDYFTEVCIKMDSGVEFSRFIVSDDLADSVEITTENVDQLFNIEGNGGYDIRYNASAHTITIAIEEYAAWTGMGWIVSQKKDSTWEHSTCVMKTQSLLNPSDKILPTYPVGTEQFLNGGDL